MPIILGSKLVRDLPEKDRVAIGIILPIQRGNTGFFAQSYETIEQVKSNIQNLLLTRPGERLMQPNFGCPLYDLLFSQNTDQLESLIQSAIQDSIAKWLPYVGIQEIIVDQTNDSIDANVFKITLTFTVGDRQSLNTVTFNMTE
jgi:uncharacterized protein